jgi:hypothetical protein
MSARRVRGGLAALAVAAALAAAGPARAQGQPGPDAPTDDAAAQAYDAGVEAHRQRDYARAAALFARADDLAPAPASRLAALKSALLADDPVLGMVLVERASRAGGVDGPLRDAVKEAEGRFSGRVGRVRIACAGCAATIDGTAAAIGQDVIVAPGERVLVISAGGRVERRSIRIEPGATVEVSPEPPATAISATPPVAPPAAVAGPRANAPSTAPRRARDGSGAGVSPAWFFVGAGLTTVLGGLTIASGIDVRAQEDAFYRAPTAEKADDGQAAETRTYVLGALTGAAGLATAAVGLFAVRWSNGAATAGVGVSGAASLGGSVRGRF